MTDRRLIHTTAVGTKVYVGPGTRGRPDGGKDFFVTHERDGDNLYGNGIFHADIVSAIYSCGVVNPGVFAVLVDHLRHTIENVQTVYDSPELIQFHQAEVQDSMAHLRTKGLETVGDYDLELFLVLFELVQIQEKTNHPRGWLPRKLYQVIRESPQNLRRVAELTQNPSRRSDGPYRDSEEDLYRCLSAMTRGVDWGEWG